MIRSPSVHLMPRPPAARALRGGLTLVEVVTTLAIIAVLMLAVGEALRFALLHAGVAPSGGASSSAAARSAMADAADQIAADLNVAINFTEQSPTALTFTVPDRDGDGEPETLRYAWSGAGGTSGASPPIPPDTLTRQLNGDGWAAIASEVRGCDFQMLYRQLSPPPTTGDRLLLWRAVNGSPSDDFWITETDAVAESFAPPPSVAGRRWSITSIKLRLKADENYDGLLNIQVRTADGLFRPTNIVLEETQAPEGALSDVYMVVTLHFTRLNNLRSDQNLALVISGGGGTGRLGAVACAQMDEALVDPHFFTTADGAWARPVVGGSLRFALYGQVEP